MGTKFPELFAALAAKFDPREVKERSQSGRKFMYVTARVIMNRLDTVLGPEGWWDEYVPGENSVLCRLTIVLPDGTHLTKADAGGYAGMADSGDDDKSGYSDAFKRAAVKFGVSRYLYGDGVPTFVAGDRFAVEGKDPTVTRAEPEPTRPAPTNGKASRGTWGNGKSETNGAQRRRSEPTPPPAHTNDCPFRTGKDLFRWVKDTEQAKGVGVFKYINCWGKFQQFPGRIVDWDAEQVILAYAEIQRKLAAIESQEPAYEEALA